MWHHLYIDDATTAQALSLRLYDEHFAALVLRRDPESAIFSRLDVETHGVHFYFTPAASGLAMAHGASPCGPPTRQEAGGLISGEATASALLGD